MKKEANEEKLLNQAANAKLIHLNEQVLFPMLQSRIEMGLADICEQFKRDGTVKLGTVALVTACRDMFNELERVARQGDVAATKLNLNPPQ